MAVSIETLGSMVLDVNGSRLDAMFLDSNGSIRDDFTILKLPMSGRVAENTAAAPPTCAQIVGKGSTRGKRYSRHDRRDKCKTKLDIG